VRLTIFGAVLTITAFAVSANVIPPLMTTISGEIKVGYNTFGGVIMLQFVSFFAAGVGGGWLCQRFGVKSRTLVAAGLVLVSLTLAAGALLKNLSWFTLWVIPLGVGGGFVETFGCVMISNFEKPHSSKLMNLSQVFYCFGAIGAPPTVSMLLYLNLSWQMIFVFFGMFILMILCSFLVLTKKDPSEEGHAVQADKPAAVGLLRDALFYLLGVTLFLYVTVESVLACWVAVYFEKGLSCSIHASALRISVFWAGLILGRAAMAVFSRRLTLWPAMFAGSLVMCLGAACAALTATPAVVTILVFLTGLGAGPLWPTTVAICHAARNRAQFTSSVIAIGAIGVVVGSGLGAFIFRHMGFRWFFPVIAIGTAMLGAAIFLSYQTCSKQKAAG